MAKRVFVVGTASAFALVEHTVTEMTYGETGSLTSTVQWVCPQSGKEC